MEIEDRELIRAVAEGEPDALRELYQRYGYKLLSYLVGQLGGDHTLAEETLQEVMLAVWQRAGAFRGESSVWTWMLAIARYQALNKRQRTKPPGLPLDDSLIAPMNSEIQDEFAALSAALDRLPSDQRETLELIFYHDLSGEETAALMGVAVGTVKSRLHRAKAALRKLLRREEYPYE
jgi:RNA polymerase sigma factor (sigma-70 family)